MNSAPSDPSNESPGRRTPRRKSTFSESISRGALYTLQDAKHSVNSVRQRRQSIAPELAPLIPPLESATERDVKCTVNQSILNATNILMGLAVLAFPYALSKAGWIAGLILLGGLSALTLWTGTLLSRIMTRHPEINTYSDMATSALGQKIALPITILFLTEIFAACVSIVLVMSDSLYILLETTQLKGFISPMWLKVMLVALLTPITWSDNLRWLSYTSLLGILSVLNLAGIIIYDGLYRHDKPGSLNDPMPTNIWPTSWLQLPLLQGIFMSGFAGHAVFPNLIADMESRREFPTVLTAAYSFVLVVSLVVSAVGYLMFGSGTMTEITMNLSEAKLGYPAWLQLFTIGLMALNAATKYSLTVGGVNLNLESLLAEFDFDVSGVSRIVLRSIVAACVCVTAIVFPEIHKVLSLLGSFFSFLVCVIIPCICYLRVFEVNVGERTAVGAVLGLSTVLMVVGTVWTFLPEDLIGG